MRHGFRVSVGADPDGVAKVNAAFGEFALTHSLPEHARRSLNVALDELLANTISHGKTGPGSGLLTVEMELDEVRVTVTITDDGPEFDPFQRDGPDTTLSLEDRSIGGLGIHLVRELMDEVSYTRRKGQNVVVLAKDLSEAG